MSERARGRRALDPSRVKDARTGDSAAATGSASRRGGSTSRSSRRWRAASSTTCPGPGKPIKDLGAEHDPDWWVKQLIEREQITGSCRRPSSCARRTPSSTRQLDELHVESEVRRELEEFNGRVIKARYTPVDGPAADHPAPRRRGRGQPPGASVVGRRGRHAVRRERGRACPRRSRCRRRWFRRVESVIPSG